MENAHAQATAEQEAAVARCRFLTAAALDNARVHAEHCCERLEEGFIRERDRAAVAEFVLADRRVLLRDTARQANKLKSLFLQNNPGDGILLQAHRGGTSLNGIGSKLIRNV